MRGNDTPRRKLRSTSRAREPTARRIFKQSSESVDRVRPRAGIADLSFGLKASKEAMTLRIADGSDRRSISIEREAPIARAYKVRSIARIGSGVTCANVIGESVSSR
jgi:hypothetical protein